MDTVSVNWMGVINEVFKTLYQLRAARPPLTTKMLRGLQDAAEEQVVDDINNDLPIDDGGSSKKLSQGEIIFVTVLSFIVFLALMLSIYCYIQRKKRKSQEAEVLVDEGKELKEQAPASVIDIGGPSSSGVHQHSSHGDSSHHRQQERRKSTRRSSNGSIGSVGSDYKKAAIDHMNTLSSGGY